MILSQFFMYIIVHNTSIYQTTCESNEFWLNYLKVLNVMLLWYQWTFLVVETIMGFKVASIIRRNHLWFQDFHSMIFFLKTKICNLFQFISPSQVQNVDSLLSHGTWSSKFLHKYLLCVMKKVFCNSYV
jgi:hypothetical protein